MTLSDLKRNRDLLLSVLGREKDGKHLKCPFHEDGHGSLSVWQGDDGVWLWFCHSGCGTGTVIDAAMHAWGAKSPAEAFREIQSRLGVKIGRDEEYREPILDPKRTERLVAAAHEKLLSDFEVQEKYLIGKRGIHDLEVVKRFRLGFVQRASFKEFYSWRITGWVIPITDAKGRVRAVRLHSEGRRGRKQPKCLWAPLGTYPTDKPHHGTVTLWPPPEQWQGCDRLYLVPGELKAIALIAAGFNATSITSGESEKFPVRLAERLKACRPGRLFIVFDDDEAGRKWRDAAKKTLEGVGLAVSAFNYGEQPDEPEAAPEVALAEQSEDLDALDAEWAAAEAVAPGDPLEMSIAQFRQSGLLLEVKSKVLGETIYFAADGFAAERAPAGATVYLPDELGKVAAVDPGALQVLHRVKKRFEGRVEDA